MDELVRWLGEQLDEDERIARAATPGPCTVDSATYAERIDSPDGPVVAGGRWGGEASVFESTEDALHIAAHDPARVLREIDAKRNVLRMYEEAGGLVWNASDDESRNTARTEQLAITEVLRLLALPYSDRSGYREEWRP